MKVVKFSQNNKILPNSILGDWTGTHCDVHKLKCWPGENRGPCGKHGECRYDQTQDFYFCACHLWWKGVY